jgi:hypothetical protein
MKPTIGRIVIVKGIESNGSDEHPAIINCAHTDAMLNVTVFPDCGTPTSKTSVPLVHDRVAAAEYVRRNPGQLVCFWPERV